jgi:hypothetical protein
MVTFDEDGNPLEGVRNYKLRLPSSISAKYFWSINVYDTQTRLIVHTDQNWPSVFSNCQTLIINQDGSIDIRFGPDAPVENNNTFIQTIGGIRWLMILRFYGPKEAWFDKTWRPVEIVELK